MAPEALTMHEESNLGIIVARMQKDIEFIRSGMDKDIGYIRDGMKELKEALMHLSLADSEAVKTLQREMDEREQGLRQQVEEQGQRIHSLEIWRAGLAGAMGLLMVAMTAMGMALRLIH